MKWDSINGTISMGQHQWDTKNEVSHIDCPTMSRHRINVDVAMHNIYVT